MLLLLLLLLLLQLTVTFKLEIPNFRESSNLGTWESNCFGASPITPLQWIHIEFNLNSQCNSKDAVVKLQQLC